MIDCHDAPSLCLNAPMTPRVWLKVSNPTHEAKGSRLWESQAQSPHPTRSPAEPSVARSEAVSSHRGGQTAVGMVIVNAPMRERVKSELAPIT